MHATPRWTRWLLLGASLAAGLVLACAPAAAPPPVVAASPVSGTRAVSPSASMAVPKPANPDVILATTTSTVDSGLLDVLVPLFEQQTGYRVKTLALGTGQALAIGERGEADVVLVHAPEQEEAWLAAGNGVNRQRVMYNDFVLIGPPGDPAGVRGRPLLEAMRAIAARGAPFISRGDNSGTHSLEVDLWRQAGVAPAGEGWYQETGQGMGATLQVAGQKAGYTVTDRATWLAQQARLQLPILVEMDPALFNQYHVMQVNPAKSERINATAARAFVNFMVAPETARIIERFGVDRYGQALFVPNP